jgi:hypothetical protein
MSLFLANFLSTFDRNQKQFHRMLLGGVLFSVASRKEENSPGSACVFTGNGKYGNGTARGSNVFLCSQQIIRSSGNKNRFRVVAQSKRGHSPKIVQIGQFRSLLSPIPKVRWRAKVSRQYWQTLAAVSSVLEGSARSTNRTSPY